MPFDATPDPGRPGRSLEGKMLIAMPAMGDPRFSRTVIFMCAHSPGGALGLIVNKHAGEITFADLLSQFDIAPDPDVADMRVHLGGPVETERGFVLHSDDYFVDDVTMPIRSHVGLTANIEILKEMAAGKGPRKRIVALGYSGWGPGQLESEIQANAWLHCDADEDLMFAEDMDATWQAALAKLGIDLSNFSGEAGRA